jgi:hypothetical protein
VFVLLLWVNGALTPSSPAPATPITSTDTAEQNALAESTLAIPPPRGLPAYLRQYYVCIEEIDWTYADIATGFVSSNGSRPFQSSELLYLQQSYSSGVLRMGATLRKAVYRQYTDITFTTPLSTSLEDQHGGIISLVMRGEVGDTIFVYACNRASGTFSLHPHGVFYDHTSEGFAYNDGTVVQGDDFLAPGGNDAVPPLARRARSFSLFLVGVCFSVQTHSNTCGPCTRAAVLRRISLSTPSRTLFILT